MVADLLTKNYSKLMMIAFVMLLIAVIAVGVQVEGELESYENNDDCDGDRGYYCELCNLGVSHFCHCCFF